MDTDVMQAVARYVEETMGSEGFRYVSAVVANCKMLAVQLEMQEDSAVSLDTDALVIAAYFHDISTVAHGFHGHHVKSAEMAAEFLRSHNVSKDCSAKVQQAILGHTTMSPQESRGAITQINWVVSVA